MPKESLKENHNVIDITLPPPRSAPKWGGHRKVALLYRGALTCPIFVTTPTPTEGKTKTIFLRILVEWKF